jgi:diguanylate cyclase
VILQFLAHLMRLCRCLGNPWAAAGLALWMLIVPMASQAQASAGDVVVLPEAQSAVTITSGVDYLIEEAGQALTAEQAMAASGWKRHEGRKLNLSRRSTPVWIRVSLDNQARHPWILGVDWPPLEQLRFHLIEAATGRVMAIHEAGLNTPSDGTLRDTGYSFALPLKQGERATVLMRVYTRAGLIVPMTVFTPETYVASRYAHDLAMGVLFGILSIMLLYNASLFVFTRDGLYAYYSVYLLAGILFEVASTGYGAMLLWGHASWLTGRSFDLFICLTYLTGALFIYKALDLKDVPWPHLRWLKYAAMSYWAVAAVLVALHPSVGLSRSIGVVGMLGGLSAVYTSVFMAVKGNVTARYFVVAWAGLLGFTAIHILSLFGVLESNWFTAYGQHVGFVSLIVLLSVALAHRIQRDRQARHRAREESLALTRKVHTERDEKIKAQDEVIAVQTRANEELEGRVLDRTLELELAMKKLETANAELSTLSVTDALTQVHNRRYFDEVLHREHDRSARSGVPLALLLADIDHFKRINDRCGHVAGDDCLRLVAATLTKTVGRSTDLVARYGGEEFALVLPSTEPAQALALAERVRAAVAAIEFSCAGQPVRFSISIGVVAQVVPANGSVEEFVAEADAALFRAKNAGRNRVVMAG